MRPALRHRQRAVACQAVRACPGRQPELMHAPLTAQAALHSSHPQRTTEMNIAINRMPGHAHADQRRAGRGPGRLRKRHAAG
jgi:hypothetical protein